MADQIYLFKYAINYLSKYSSSKKNLERTLKNKIVRMKIDKKDKFILYNSIPEILIKLENNKFIDDSLYASSKINTFITNGKSKIYISSYLLKKGVEKKLIQELLQKKDEENFDWEIEAAKKFIRKKNFSKFLENKEKLMSKMARAGFSYEIVKKLLDES